MGQQCCGLRAREEEWQGPPDFARSLVTHSQEKVLSKAENTPEALARADTADDSVASTQETGYSETSLEALVEEAPVSAEASLESTDVLYEEAESLKCSETLADEAENTPEALARADTADESVTSPQEQQTEASPDVLPLEATVSAQATAAEADPSEDAKPLAEEDQQEGEVAKESNTVAATTAQEQEEVSKESESPSFTAEAVSACSACSASEAEKVELMLPDGCFNLPQGEDTGLVRQVTLPSQQNSPSKRSQAAGAEEAAKEQPEADEEKPEADAQKEEEGEEKEKEGEEKAQPKEGEQKKKAKVIQLPNCDQVLEYLYLGGMAAAKDVEGIQTQGVKAVVCCCRELEFPDKEYVDGVDYFRVDIEDMSREPLDYFLEEATAFIHAKVVAEQPVLVHCRAGVSRSASVVLAYLVAKQGMPLADAFFFLRARRSIVTPNIGFFEQVANWEQKLYQRTSVAVHKYMMWYGTSESERTEVPELSPDA